MKGNQTNQNHHAYIAIDLKSFYASVECVQRGLDPLTTNLVVADQSRTEKTICLAVSPSLKEYGISGRARLFEVVQKIREVNSQRRQRAPGRAFTGESIDSRELKASCGLGVSYITAPPRMALYMEFSARIYEIYLKYVAPEDIHVYSVDEVFMDVTDYLKAYGLTARALAQEIMEEIFKETGITATAGIGSNLYLSKVAMDIVAKHVTTGEGEVRIAELDELTYRRLLWGHRPLTDFWRVGRGYAKKLEEHGLYTMGDIARCSYGRANDFHNEKLLYKLFGVNAELLIDHAWGWEPCTIADVKAYKPRHNSICSGQVLQSPYEYEQAKLVVKEMADMLAFGLLEKGLVTNQITLTIGFDRANLENAAVRKQYRGKVKSDFYGRKVPEHAHGTANIGRYTSSSKLITEAAMEIYERTVDKILLIRRVTIEAGYVILEQDMKEQSSFQQLDLFTDYDAEREKAKEADAMLERERQAQLAMLHIRQKYGKNAVLRASSLEDGATAKGRNQQIGGHRA